MCNPVQAETELNSLKLLAGLETTEDREFNFASADETYTLMSDIGFVSDGKLTINGITAVDGDGNTIRSTIDMNGHEGLSITDNVTLNINDVIFQNAQGSESRNGGIVSAPHGVLNINNSVFDNNKVTSAQRGGAIALFDGTSEIAFGGSAARNPRG